MGVPKMDKHRDFNGGSRHVVHMYVCYILYGVYVLIVYTVCAIWDMVKRGVYVPEKGRRAFAMLLSGVDFA